MEKFIYRSTGFEDKTRWSYPLKMVEIVVIDSNFAIYLYDVGEPPFYDTTKINTMFDVIKDWESALEFLNNKNIFVSGWYKVSNLFFHESNAVIREDIRADISKIYSEIKIKGLDNEIGFSFLNNNKNLKGSTVFIHVIYSHEEVNIGFGLGGGLTNISRSLKSYTNYGYVMFDNPNGINSWRLVCKATQDNITVGIEAGETINAYLYSQELGREISRGKLHYFRIDDPTNGCSFVFKQDGIDVCPFKLEFYDQ